jgi:hypothetical protein
LLHIAIHDHFSGVYYRDERGVDKKGDKSVIDEASGDFEDILGEWSLGSRF